MGAGSDALLKIIIEAENQTGKEFKGLRKEVDGLDKDTEQASRSFDGLGTAIGAAVSVAAISKVTQMGAELYQVGAAAQQTRANFEAMSGDAAGGLVELRDAVGGTINNMTLMASASQMMRMGLADTTTEAARLAEMAVQLKPPTVSAEQAMGDFSAMLANQSIPRLDNFGMSSGRVRTRINELMDTVEGMTREQAFMTAVLEEGDVAMAQLGDQTASTQGDIDRLKASVDNLKTSFGAAFSEAANVGPIGQAIAGIADKASGYFGKIAEGRPIMQSFYDELESQRDLGALTAKEYRQLDREADKLFYKFEYGNMTVEELTAAFAELDPTIMAIAQGNTQASTSAQLSADAMRDEAAAMRELQAAQATETASAPGVGDLRFATAEQDLALQAELTAKRVEALQQQKELEQSILDDALAGMQSAYVDHTTTMANLAIEGEQAITDATWDYQLQRQQATINYQAEREALLAAGHATEAEELARKFEADAETASAAYQNEQMLLERDQLQKQLVQQRSYVQQLRDQKQATILKLTNMVIEAQNSGKIKVTEAKTILGILKTSADEQLKGQITHAENMASVSSKLSQQMVGDAITTTQAILAAYDQDLGAAQGALDALSSDFSQFSNEILDGLQDTFSAGGDFGSNFGSSVAGGISQAEEPATQAMADVVADVESGLDAMEDAMRTLPGLMYTPEMERGFAEAGKFLLASVNMVYDVVDQEGVQEKLNKVRELLDPLKGVASMATAFDPTKIKTAGSDFEESLTTYVFQAKRATGILFQWAMDVPGAIMEMYEAQELSKEEAIDLLKEGSQTAGYLGKLYDVFGDLSKVKPAEGNWERNLVLSVRQGKQATGEAYKWIRDMAPEARAMLEQYGGYAESMTKLYKLIEGPDMSKMASPADLIVQGNYLERSFEVKKAMVGHVIDWLGDLDEETRAAYATTAEVTDHVDSFLKLATADIDIESPRRGSIERAREHFEGIETIVEEGLPIIERVDQRWGETLVRASDTMANLEAYFESAQGVTDTIAAIRDVGGPDVGAAQAIHHMMAELVGSHTQSTAPTVGTVAGVGPSNTPVNTSLNRVLQALADLLAAGIQVTGVLYDDAGNITGEINGANSDSVSDHIAASMAGV